MEIHSASAQVTEDMIRQLKDQHAKVKTARPFEDPIREFHHASQVEGVVRNWLTIPKETRKQMMRESFEFIPQRQGEPSRGIEGESDREFTNRRMDRWRALCVIIQEESRAEVGVRCPEVAIAALKLLFPEHPWPKPSPYAAAPPPASPVPVILPQKPEEPSALPTAPLEVKRRPGRAKAS